MRFQKKYSNPREQAAYEAGVRAGLHDASLCAHQMEILKESTDTKRLDFMITHQAMVVASPPFYYCEIVGKSSAQAISGSTPRESIDNFIRVGKKI